MPEPVTRDDTIGGIGADSATIADLSNALASGATTSRALTAFYTQRIEQLNHTLHAVISMNPGAPSEAAACDEARGSHPPGPLAGIPVLVKDNIAARGMPATAGSPALAEAEQDEAFLVRRLREAGAVILGKANLSEWANFRSTLGTSGWSTLGGQAANPHALDRNPSGSSSGSAVAVAAGLAPVAVGTETDGSILCPASACGIVGIKPTMGLVSRAGIVPISAAQDTAGPLARPRRRRSASPATTPPSSTRTRSRAPGSACGAAAPSWQAGPPPPCSTGRWHGCARRARRSSTRSSSRGRTR